MCITREVAHSFATLSRDNDERHVRLPLISASLFPFRALRIAQLQALGMDCIVAMYVADLLPPWAPCADADEERLLLDAARFLLHNGFIPALRLPEAAATNASFASGRTASVAQWSAFGGDNARLRENCVVIADLSFFVDAQLRAAEARGQPLRNAFSFSGRTLASMTRLAAQHRREALVNAAVAKVRSDGGAHFDPDKLRGIWRAQLTWDDECDRMLALRCPDSGMLPLGSARWPADVQLRGMAAAAAASSQNGVMPLHGEWHMRRLNDAAAICKEGKEQHNCLRHGAYLSTSRSSSYWSLRFTPDAAGEAQLVADEQLRRSAAQLRLTVHVYDKSVSEARAPSNNMPPLAALQALAEWGRRAGVRVPQYKSSSNAR
jgi:hypothetical protein